MPVSEQVTELAYHTSARGAHVNFENVVNAAEVRSGRIKRMDNVLRIGYLRVERIDVCSKEALVAIAREAVVVSSA